MKLSLTPAILAVSLFALPAHAQTVDLSWNTCSPIVTSKIAPEGALVSFYASITGQSEGHKGYELWWLVGNASLRGTLSHAVSPSFSALTVYGTPSTSSVTRPPLSVVPLPIRCCW